MAATRWAMAAAVLSLGGVLLAACGGGSSGPADAPAASGTEDAVTTGSVQTVAYGDHQEQVADLRLPDGTPPDAGWPTVVLVHGGFWREPYRRDLMTPLAEDLAARGFASWNVEYRRVGGGAEPEVSTPAASRVGGGAEPEVSTPAASRTGGDGGWPTTLTDVAAAVDHLTAVAEDAPVDLERVGVVGHSAGGHLALWVTGRTRLPDGAPGGDPEVVPCAAVGQAPVADFEAGVDLGDGAVVDLLGGTPDEVPDRYAVADPIGLVGHGVPVLLVHGEDDDTVPLEQSERYADAVRAIDGEVRVSARPGDHFTVIDPGSESWADAVAFLDVTC